jgi:hypothetical protein
MHRQVIGPVTLDDVLRLLHGGMSGVSLELYRGRHHLDDISPHPARFGVPLHWSPILNSCNINLYVRRGNFQDQEL